MLPVNVGVGVGTGTGTVMLLLGSCEVTSRTVGSRDRLRQDLRMNDQQNGPGAALDELDVRILHILQSDARITNRDLAAAVHVSPTTALDRTRSLRRRGVITGATLTLDFAALGRGVQALIAVRIRPPSRRNIEGFRDWVSTLPEVIGVFVTSGNEDFLIHMAVADNEALYAFVIDRLTERPEVMDVRTSVVYEHIRSAPVMSATPRA